MSALPCAAMASPEMVDMVFDLAGDALPADHREALWQEVRRELPWLEELPAAGLHALRTAPTSYGMALLPRRAKLVARIPRSRVDAAAVLAGRRLEVAGQGLAVGGWHLRELPEAGTLYADFVSVGTDDELLFLERVGAELAGMGVDCRLIPGRSRRLRQGGTELHGFALALHEVPVARSRLLQQAGLGEGRKLGCGILVQHKAITGID